VNRDEDRSHPIRTERVHAESSSSSDGFTWLDLFDAQEEQVSRALSQLSPQVVDLSRRMAEALRCGGRVVYFGAGTSGRLGALDAAEWPPTFGLAADRIIARLAGGPDALSSAVEGAEDDGAAGVAEVESLQLGANDLIVGISASGSAAFVISALGAARARGVPRALITASTPPPIDDDRLDLILHLGPELLAGSTRLQAATATHRVLQRASCLCALELGWIFRGRMVEMRPTNQKLRRRAEEIVIDLANVDLPEARSALQLANDDVKAAILIALLSCTADQAHERLRAVDRHLDQIEELR